MTMNETKLPKRFVILRDADNPLWDKYIQWLNEKFRLNLEGAFYGYYGVNDIKFNCISQNSIELAHYSQLTLEQWDVAVNGDSAKKFDMSVIDKRLCMTHELKTWCEYYEQVANGFKTFEVRKADRPFDVGDTLLLKEWDNEKKVYTGRECKKIVTYILQGGSFGIEQGTVVMAIQ